MIKIGDFSKIMRVTVKALRLYDEMGLLKPVYVDPFTHYRYYTAAQFSRLNIILALKDVGLSLEQIGNLLEEDLPAEQMLGMLHRRKAELLQEIRNSNNMLGRIEARLMQFEKEQKIMENDILIKSVPSFWIVSVRGIAQTYPEQGHLWERLDLAMKQTGLQSQGPCFVLDHDEEYKLGDHDLEACFQVGGETHVVAPAQTRLLEAEASMACLTHHGAFNQLPQRYQELLHWIELNGWQIYGPGREIYLFTGDQPVRQDDPSYVTEIQFPVRRANNGSTG